MCSKNMLTEFEFMIQFLFLILIRKCSVLSNAALHRLITAAKILVFLENKLKKQVNIKIYR